MRGLTEICTDRSWPVWNGRFGACNGYKQTETPTIDVCLRRHHDTIADSFAESFHSR